MSLLSDPECVSVLLFLPLSTANNNYLPHHSLLIHSLRLGYLRNVVEDPYGPRLISFNPAFPTNPYIAAASLADTTKWPELGEPSSPPLSPDDSDGDSGSGSGAGGGSASVGAVRPRSISGFPGATGLKHSQTILGPSRTGVFGMGVGGRRRHVAAAKLSQTTNGTPISARDNERDAVGTTASTTSSTTMGTAKTAIIISMSPPRPEEQQGHASVSASVDTPPPPPVKPVFVPKFRGAAEMDERRRQRLQARRGAAAAAAAAAVAAPQIEVIASSDRGATLDLMSSGEEAEEEDEELDEEDEDEDPFSHMGDEDFVHVGVSVDIDEDEFDPCVLYSLSFSFLTPLHLHSRGWIRLRMRILSPASSPLRGWQA